MSSSKRQGGAQKRANKNKQNKNKQNKNKQHGGSCGNSSSAALSNSGVTPMPNYKLQQGGSVATTASPYSGSVAVIPVAGGNAFIKGGNANAVLPVAPVVPVIGGVENVPNGMLPSSTPMPVVTGGNVLNDIAVPAVLLYANQAFGKKKNYTSKPSRRFRKNNNKSRRFRRR